MSRSITILAIDPGTTQSAWVMLENGLPTRFGIDPNDVLLATLRATVAMLPDEWAYPVVIERIASYGMPVGAEVFETVYWSGRFAEAAYPLPVHRLTRLAVKSHLCHSGKAKDANVRQALLDRYGEGSIKKGGALHGIKADLWAALAVAVTYADTTPHTPPGEVQS